MSATTAHSFAGTKHPREKEDQNSIVFDNQLHDGADEKASKRAKSVQTTSSVRCIDDGDGTSSSADAVLAAAAEPRSSQPLSPSATKGISQNQVKFSFDDGIKPIVHELWHQFKHPAQSSDFARKLMETLTEKFKHCPKTELIEGDIIWKLHEELFGLVYGTTAAWLDAPGELGESLDTFLVQTAKKHFDTESITSMMDYRTDKKKQSFFFGPFNKDDVAMPLPFTALSEKTRLDHDDFVVLNDGFPLQKEINFAYIVQRCEAATVACPASSSQAPQPMTTALEQQLVDLQRKEKMIFYEKPPDDTSVHTVMLQGPCGAGKSSYQLRTLMVNGGIFVEFPTTDIYGKSSMFDNDRVVRALMNHLVVCAVPQAIVDRLIALDIFVRLLLILAGALNDIPNHLLFGFYQVNGFRLNPVAASFEQLAREKWQHRSWDTILLQIKACANLIRKITNSSFRVLCFDEIQHSFATNIHNCEFFASRTGIKRGIGTRYVQVYDKVLQQAGFDTFIHSGDSSCSHKVMESVRKPTSPITQLQLYAGCVLQTPEQFLDYLGLQLNIEPEVRDRLRSDPKIEWDRLVPTRLRLASHVSNTTAYYYRSAVTIIPEIDNEWGYERKATVLRDAILLSKAQFVASLARSFTDRVLDTCRLIDIVKVDAQRSRELQSNLGTALDLLTNMLRRKLVSGPHDREVLASFEALCCSTEPFDSPNTDDKSVHVNLNEGILFEVAQRVSKHLARRTEQGGEASKVIIQYFARNRDVYTLTEEQKKRIEQEY